MKNQRIALLVFLVALVASLLILTSTRRCHDGATRSTAVSH
jgi:hypothetical protein